MSLRDAARRVVEEFDTGTNGPRLTGAVEALRTALDDGVVVEVTRGGALKIGDTVVGTLYKSEERLHGIIGPATICITKED